MLTEEKIIELVTRHSRAGFMVARDFARAIEAAVLEAQGKQEPVAEVIATEAGATVVPTGKNVLRVGQQFYAEPVVQPDFFPDACRLALELECLLLSCNDNAAVSKWWDSAHEALEQHRAMIAAVREEQSGEIAKLREAKRELWWELVNCKKHLNINSGAYSSAEELIAKHGGK